MKASISAGVLYKPRLTRTKPGNLFFLPFSTLAIIFLDSLGEIFSKESIYGWAQKHPLLTACLLHLTIWQQQFHGLHRLLQN